MDVVIAPGAKEFLKENGGLRAKILTDGELHLGDAQLRIVKDVEAQAAAKAWNRRPKPAVIPSPAAAGSRDDHL